MRLAVIDIGTNSLHMIVCEVGPDGAFRVIDREKEELRLGRGTLKERRLTDAGMTAAIETLSRFLRIAASRGVDDVVATATAAVREAENGGDFVAAVQQRLRLPIRVIPGTEEARLIHLAALNAVDLGGGRAVVIDIGGGSTEVTLGTADRVILARSFKLGVVGLMEHFGGARPLSASDERRLVRHIRHEFGSSLTTLARRRFDRVIGTSATILSLGTLAVGATSGRTRGLLRVPARAIRRLRRRLTTLTLAERLKLPLLGTTRADLAPVGAVLIDTILEDLGADEITLCDHALREGLIYDYIQRDTLFAAAGDRHPDVRRRSVMELAERCRYIPAHARQVAALSLTLFDATRARHGLGAREREWLEYGALLHDVGAHIRYEQHHKHSHYIIRHGGLRGFEPEEVEAIALIARYHRRGVPRKSHQELEGRTRDERRTVATLSAMVRLAEALDRSHAQVIEGMTVRATAQTLAIELRTSGDAELEMWAAQRHAGPLADALELSITVSSAGQRPGRSRIASTSRAGSQ
jgi:exopolyphosphatase/guanosine-5'-triphosphate,3'-diphosphate pyrophosphatase